MHKMEILYDYIPNDKFNIAALEYCWEGLINKIKDGIFDLRFFNLLSVKTYDLLREYDEKDDVPKETVKLFAIIYQFVKLQPQNIIEPDIENLKIAQRIIFIVVRDILWSLISSQPSFTIEYNEREYIVDAKTFEFHPVDPKK